MMIRMIIKGVLTRLFYDELIQVVIVCGDAIEIEIFGEDFEGRIIFEKLKNR